MSRFAEEQQKRMQRIGIPRRPREDVSADSFDPSRPAVVEACEFFRKSDPRPFLVMVGGVGCGKSDAAAWGVMSAGMSSKRVTVIVEGAPVEVDLSPQPPSACWVHAFEIVKASTYDREFWAKVERPDLLVIDDLGTRPLDGKGYAASNIADLLCYREAQDAKTLITANLTWEQFEADYLSGPGERVRDRLRRIDGMFYRVAGGSMRRTA